MYVIRLETHAGDREMPPFNFDTFAAAERAARNQLEIRADLSHVDIMVDGRIVAIVDESGERIAQRIVTPAGRPVTARTRRS